MKGRGARETLSFGAAWPRAGRQGPTVILGVVSQII